MQSVWNVKILRDVQEANILSRLQVSTETECVLTGWIYDRGSSLGWCCVFDRPWIAATVWKQYNPNVGLLVRIGNDRFGLIQERHRFVRNEG